MRRVVTALALAGAVLTAAACDSSKLLGPDAAQGIEGLVLLGPQCPVSTPEDPCPDLPYATAIDILDDEQNLVTRVESGADGTFRVGLEPGLYILVPVQGDPFPVADDEIADVRAGVWSSVTINYDTGIR